MKKHNIIDVMKFVFCYAAIAIHTEPWRGRDIGIMSNVVDLLVSLAVPFFFISSGFLLNHKIHEDSNWSADFD